MPPSPQAALQMPPAADPAAASGEPARAQTDAVHQRRLRGLAGAHPHSAVRETPV